MISSLELGNVRLFSGQGHKFDFPQLTVFCGINSAGKSTVLKMFLFLRENTRTGTTAEIYEETGLLALTNDQMDLGDYVSLVSDGDIFREVSVRVTFKTDLPRRLENQIPDSSQAENVQLDLLFGLSKKLTDKYAIVSKLKSLYEQLDLDETLTANIYRRLTAIQEQLLGLVGPSNYQSFRNSNDFDSGLELVDAFAVRCIENAFTLLDEITTVDYPNSIKRVRLLVAKAAAAELRNSGEATEAVLKHFSFGLIDEQRFNYDIGGLNYIPIDLEDYLSHGKSNVTIPLRDGRIPSIILSSITDSLSKIHYIGPQRATAERCYLVSKLSYQDLSDLDGVSTPYILYRQTIQPQSVITVKPRSLKPQPQDLLTALSEWLYYLRTGEKPIESIVHEGEIEVFNLQGSLIEIKLRGGTTDSRYPLVDSGFGYSQVLPIILKGLLTNPGEVIIIEQPELHLNPALQVRLAEFFVAMIHAGKQVVLETHSEHIVNTIRVLTAEDETGTLAGKSKIYFFDIRESGPEVRELSVQSDGTVPEWPVSFFGEAGMLTSRLLKAQRRFRDSSRGNK